MPVDDAAEFIIDVYSNKYYVSTLGDDGNPGTIDYPFATVQKGLDTAQPGDVVYVRGGMYNQLTHFVRNGQSNAPITLSGYPGERAVMDGTGFTIAHRQGIIDNQLYDYLNVFNMNVQNSTAAGISVRDYHPGFIRIENCTTYNTAVSGICCYGGDTTPYSEIHDIQIKNNSVGKPCSIGQEAITLRFTKNFEVSHNYVYEMAALPYGIGIDAKQGCSYGSIHHNEINQDDPYPMGSDAIYIDAGDGALQRVCHDIDVYCNLIHGNCQGIKIGAELGGQVKDVNIYNNIVYNAVTGFRDDRNGMTDGWTYKKINIKVINNNFINCQWGAFITDYGQNFENFIWRNNIMSSINPIFLWKFWGDIPAGQLHNDHNIYSKDPGVYGGENYIIGTPAYVNEAEHDYHLTANSIAQDVGSPEGAPSFDYDGVLRPQFAGYDVGAYEYHG